MIDIHNHLLYGVDDGSKSLEASVKLIKDAENEGITDIILTPHFMKNGSYNTDLNIKKDTFNRLKQELVNEDINVNLYLGNELLIDESLGDLLINKQIASLNNSKYVLVEFPFVNYRQEYDDYLERLTYLGYVVIIAHPERYRYVKENEDFVERWIDEGYLLQVNQNAFNNKEDCKLIFDWIKKGYVYFVASDAHGEKRPCTLKGAYGKVKKAFGENIARLLFCNNALCIINNIDIDEMPLAKKRFWF